jgi:hypothetical protein
MKHHQEQPKLEKQSKKAHDTRIEEPVVKKQFISQTNTTIPSISPLDSLCQKENVLNLLNFWDSNCQQWLKSKLTVNAMNMLPLPPVFNPLQFMQSMLEKQSLATKIEESLNSKARRASIETEKGAESEGAPKEKKKESDEYNKMENALKPNDLKEPTLESRGLEILEHRILVPKPIKANYSTD